MGHWRRGPAEQYAQRIVAEELLVLRGDQAFDRGSQDAVLHGGYPDPDRDDQGKYGSCSEHPEDPASH